MIFLVQQSLGNASHPGKSGKKKKSFQSNRVVVLAEGKRFTYLLQEILKWDICLCVTY